MCPAICNDTGFNKGGVCGIICKQTLCELLNGHFPGEESSVRTGYPFEVNHHSVKRTVFEKSEWAKMRGGPV